MRLEFTYVSTKPDSISNLSTLLETKTKDKDLTPSTKRIDELFKKMQNSYPGMSHYAAKGATKIGVFSAVAIGSTLALVEGVNRYGASSLPPLLLTATLATLLSQRSVFSGASSSIMSIIGISTLGVFALSNVVSSKALEPFRKKEQLLEETQKDYRQKLAAEIKKVFNKMAKEIKATSLTKDQRKMLKEEQLPKLVTGIKKFSLLDSQNEDILAKFKSALDS